MKNRAQPRSSRWAAALVVAGSLACGLHEDPFADAGTDVPEWNGELGPKPTTCASGMFWSESSGDSEFMNPGLPCKECHQLRAPDRAYFFMGTGFPARHEKDRCIAVPPEDARVEILDADGNVQLTLVPNSSGNFFSSGVQAPFPLPYRARVVAGGKTREMATPQRDGDCNRCHTEQGAEGAPGRIVWP